MARIKSYVQDTNITDQDRILGTSYEGILNNKPIYKTVNYDITALASYFSQNFDFEGVNYNLSEIKDFQINLANSLGDVNLDGSLANISVNFANDLIALVQNTAFPQGLADYIVSIAALNEAFANQVLDLATSTAYATKDSFDALSAFVDQIDTNVQGVNIDLANVIADTDTNTGAITANATAIQALGVRTTTAEADVVALQTNFTSLETVVNQNTGDISTNATQISSLGTVVDTATIDIATLKTDVTLLESEIDTVAGTASANASDISLLTTNLNTLAGDVTAVQTDVTVLQSEVNTNTNDISTQATQVSLLANRVTTAEADILNTSTNVTNLTTTVNGNTGAISTNAANISILQSDVTTTQNQVTALQTNVTLLETEVDDTNNIATANATSISTLSATVNGNTASISTVSNAVADIEGNLSASYALTVDAGGRVAGLKLLADGTTGSEFIARANTFAVDMPNGTRVLTVNSSGLTINGSGTFSGNLSAAGGTFNGNISGASGTFTGGVSGTGYSLNNSGLNLTNTSSSISIGGGVTINQFGISGVNFSLTSGGLSASNATISGNITITSGTTLNAITDAQTTATAANTTANAANTTANAANTTANTALNRTVDAAGKIVFNPTPSGSGLFMNAVNLGYYDGGSWKTYMQNNGNFFLSGSGSNGLSWNGSTLTVNGSGVFSGELQAGLVNVNSNVISVGVNSTYSTFGEVSFKWPTGVTAFSTVTGTNTNEVAEIKAFYLTGGSYNGGGISVKGIAGVNPGELRVGTDSNGFGNWSLQSGGASIFGSNTGLLFSAGNSSYNFQNVPSLGGSALYITSGGLLTKASSSMRYKHQVTDYDKGLGIINQLRPVYFKYIQDHSVQNAGFIAEEFEELGLKEFVRYDLQLRPDTIDYAQITALLVKGIQEQQQQIDALKAEIDLLKAQ